jgi:hypothetical protein
MKIVYIIISVSIISFVAGIFAGKCTTSKPAVVAASPIQKIEPPKPDNTALLKRIQESDFEINFKAIKALSIERTIENGIPMTVIGYKKSDNSISEWNFVCSDENHKRLAEQFKKDILGK